MKKAGEFHPLKISEEPWQKISINIIEPLLKSNDKDTIVVIVDQFTKIIRLKVITMVVSSEDIVKIYSDKIWKIHGVPWKVLSNKRPQFTLQFMEDLGKTLETKQTLSIVYCPQKNSQTKRINQEFEEFLWYYVNYQQDNWTEWLSVVEFQYNDKRHVVTDYIPFKLNFGIYLWKEDLIVKMELQKRFSQKITKKLGSSKKINENGKRSHKEIV